MAEAINVSECGMLVNADDSDISSESMVEVVFDISGRRDLSAMARIRHLERTDVSASFGIQFLTPFSDGVRAVRSYCASSSV